VLRQPKPRILCIDDEPSVGELLRSCLEGSGDFLVEVETNALKAVQHARVFKPDLVVMDIKMPGRDGFDLVREIRQEPWLRHRPIIFFSGLTDVEEASLKAGIGGPTEFLQKGVPLSVIEQTIRRSAAERLALFKKCFGQPHGDDRA
jgi:CheY-like chemotaxis protein